MSAHSIAKRVALEVRSHGLEGERRAIHTAWLDSRDESNNRHRDLARTIDFSHLSDEFSANTADPYPRVPAAELLKLDKLKLRLIGTDAGSLHALVLAEARTVALSERLAAIDAERMPLIALMERLQRWVAEEGTQE